MARPPPLDLATQAVMREIAELPPEERDARNRFLVDLIVKSCPPVNLSKDEVWKLIGETLRRIDSGEIPAR